MVKARSDERIILVNCRRDRADRSKQLAELVAGWECSHIVATGGLPRVFLHRALELGVPRAKLTDLGEERPPAEVYERVFGLVTGRAMVFATGNTVGYGDSLIAHFESRADGHGPTRMDTDYGR
jgi:hypothetical protein